MPCDTDSLSQSQRHIEVFMVILPSPPQEGNPLKQSTAESALKHLLYSWPCLRCTFTKVMTLTIHQHLLNHIITV